MSKGVPFDDVVPRIPVPCGRLRTLAAFATVTAKPGRAAEARLAIPARAFARYDESPGGRVRPPGEFTVRIGRSSADLRLSVRVRSG
jgi:beta-glucosidase